MTPLARTAFVVVMLALASVTAARAERLVPAYDPRYHVVAPIQRGLDGHSGVLQFDADFAAEAARYRREHPEVVRAAGDVTLMGEVIVIQPDGQMVETAGAGFGISSNGLAAIARRVIERFGDDFHSLTIWTTFDDRNAPQAEAYEVTVRNEVSGIGMPVRDTSRTYGSRGTLRSVLNMRRVGLRIGDTRAQWQSALETWGQESAHRWLVFMLFRDPRTGRISDALLGRDCAHYSNYVDTQASVHDGNAWRDNGNGTFTFIERGKRYGNLDLYGMGLLPADEFPPFFLIDDIPNYKYPATCRDYGSNGRPFSQMVSGKRVDITIDDIVAANGPRIPAAGSRQDYWREAEVVVTAPNETQDSATVRGLAARLDKARLYWEQWNREASGGRLVMCTQVTADCGDPRSDVAEVVLDPSSQVPAHGPLAFRVDVVNGGTRTATNVSASLEVKLPDGEVRVVKKDVGVVEPGAMKPVTVSVDLRDLPCGSALEIKGSTQSDAHQSRLRRSVVVGVEPKAGDGFEEDSGWTVNPDGDDTTTGAQWERGRPEGTTLLGAQVQPDRAHAGEKAWVTGLLASLPGNAVAFVREGKATLQSPPFPTEGLREPRLRFWLSFAGVRADASGGSLEPSPRSSFAVLARGLDPQGSADPWLEIDRLEARSTAGWQARSVALPPAVLGRSRFQLRFVATEANPQQGAVEAAIDDLEIHSNLAACDEPPPPPAKAGGDAGCGCRVAGRPTRLPWFVLLLAVVSAARAGVARKRRTAPPTAGADSRTARR